MHILIQQSNKGSEGVAKGGGKKNGVARDLCPPHTYTSVYVYDSERRREEEKERERRRGCDLGGI